MDVDGSDVNYKARSVSKGFSQFHGVDYTKTFAPVAKMSQASFGHCCIQMMGGAPYGCEE